MPNHEKTKPERGTAVRSCTLSGREISPYSLFCRNCGHPQGAPILIGLLMLFLLMVLAAFVAFTMYCMCYSHALRADGSSRLHDCEPAMAKLGTFVRSEALLTGGDSAPGRSSPQRPTSSRPALTATQAPVRPDSP